MLSPSETSILTLHRPLGNPFHLKYGSNEPGRRSARLLGGLVLSLLIVGYTPRPMAAHAVLLESTPAPRSVSSGPDIAIRLRFNVRIDAERSIITLTRKDGSNSKLQAIPQPSANMLAATGVGLPVGEYRIRWQVLASDGHITSGEIPFSIAAN
jgi:hypothetical protein